MFGHATAPSPVRRATMRLGSRQIYRFFVAALLVGGLLAGSAATVHALPIVVPNFAVDPSGPAFTIQPVSAADLNSINLAADPVLEFGVTSEPDGTLNTMKMSWEQEVADVDAQAGWELVFGVDPNIQNLQIILSIAPPGGWIDSTGTSFLGPPPSLFPPDKFQGIRSLSVIAADAVGQAGGWGFNTDMENLFPLQNDPLAAGLSSMANNFMQTVTINVGLGQAPGSVSITGGPAGPLNAPNFLIGGHGNFTNITKLQFFENGSLQGAFPVIPGQPFAGLANYWDHLTVTPEPSSFLLAGFGLVALVAYGWRRRRR